MELGNRRVSGIARIAAVGVLVVAAVISGSGWFPSQTATAAQAIEKVDGGLGPVAEPHKADEIRQPSGLDALDATAQATRTPTKVRPRVTRVATSGTVTSSAGAAPVADGWQRAKVSWYGPGFIGNTMAGGGTLEWGSMVVAHRSMRFGTRIEFAYNGRTCVAVVMDRGPYVGGRTFDLGPGTAAALGFSGVGTVDYRILN